MDNSDDIYNYDCDSLTTQGVECWFGQETVWKTTTEVTELLKSNQYGQLIKQTYSTGHLTSFC